ncbi:MAG: bifunctional pyridoxamine 5'-phosphate oxidase family protein/GNAT family N-acetyltransferase [Micromonosporaceae bacterium]
MTESFTPTGRTTGLRLRERMSYERATAYAIIDEAHHCHVGFVVDGEPRVLPTLVVRVDDTLYIHGSTGSRPFLAARSEGLPVCVTVTHLDGLVLARSQFHHSANYRSVVAHGRAYLVTDQPEKLRVLTALVEKVAHGRSAETRPPNARELAETNVLALPLAEVSVKFRMGQVSDEPEDHDLPYWAGVVPLRLTPGVPDPAEGVRVPVPANLQPDRSPWLQAPTLRGDHVVLEALDLSHVDDLFANTGDDEVWQHLTRPRPASPDELAGHVREALRAQACGVRVTWAQRCAHTGATVGMTSYYAPDEINGSVAIGYTMLGRPWWRTGINTEAKLLLLGRAFDELGAERVEFHTDIRNVRSQRAIERLGAERDGVLRRHRRRPDGSWRDSVVYSMTAPEWPAARDRLRERLRAAAPVG